MIPVVLGDVLKILMFVISYHYHKLEANVTKGITNNQKPTKIQ